MIESRTRTTLWKSLLDVFSYRKPSYRARKSWNGWFNTLLFRHCSAMRSRFGGTFVHDRRCYPIRIAFYPTSKFYLFIYHVIRIFEISDCSATPRNQMFDFLFTVSISINCNTLSIHFTKTLADPLFAGVSISVLCGLLPLPLWNAPWLVFPKLMYYTIGLSTFNCPAAFVPWVGVVHSTPLSCGLLQRLDREISLIEVDEFQLPSCSLQKKLAALFIFKFRERYFKTIAN